MAKRSSHSGVRAKAFPIASSLRSAVGRYHFGLSGNLICIVSTDSHLSKRAERILAMSAPSRFVRMAVEAARESLALGTNYRILRKYVG